MIVLRDSIAQKVSGLVELESWHTAIAEEQNSMDILSQYISRATEIIGSAPLQRRNMIKKSYGHITNTLAEHDTIIEKLDVLKK